LGDYSPAFCPHNDILQLLQMVLIEMRNSILNGLSLKLV
jgi:hypothetical protein